MELRVVGVGDRLVRDKGVDLVRFAPVFARAGKPFVGAQLLSFAAALRTDISFVVVESWMTRTIEEALEAVRAQLDKAAFAEAWEAGAKLSLDEAVALALGEADEAGGADFHGG